MTISRRDWRGAPVPGGAPTVERVDAFGWVCHKHVLSDGHRLVTYAREAVPRERAPNLAIHTAGRGVVTNSELGPLPDRAPGMFSGERPDHPAGVTTVVADGELEWWCFNWHANRGALPAAQPLRAENAEVVELPAGQRVLLCKGRLGQYAEGPFVATGEPLVATGQVYGFLIEADRG